MQCEEAINLISAEIDREISPDERHQLEAHLAGCADCRATAEAMRLQDAQLVRAFAPRRKTAADIASQVALQISHTRRPLTQWLVPLAAAAAGFLLALLILPSKTNHPITPVPNGVAVAVAIGRLDIATGPVEVRSSGGDWQPMATGATVIPASQVRTGPGVRCEFAMNDGSQIRVNENTELELKESRTLSLGAGQVFSLVAKSHAPFQVAVGSATVTALGTRFDVQKRAERTVLTVLEGSTRVNNRTAEQIVQQGQIVSLTNGRVTPLQPEESLDQATRWIDEILVLKGRDNPELNRRIDDLFAQIGEGKMAFLREHELKALGDHCVVPLTRYLQSPRSGHQTFKRQEAARIIADVAQPWCIPYLIELLQDTDGEVRFSAASALLRLTSRTQNRSPELWRSEPAEAGRRAFMDWQDWWQKNKDAYPGAATQQSTLRT